MSTLHGSAPSLLRRAEGCVPLEGMIASARDFLKSTHIHLEPPDLVGWAVDPSSRTSSLHMGASESLQSLFSYSSDPIFPLFSLQLRVLRDWLSLSIGQITFIVSPWIMLFTWWVCHVFSIGLSFFFLGSTHPFTLLSLTWCFGICSSIMVILFLHCTPITGSVPHHLFDTWFNFQLDAHIFITERWKARFCIHTFSRDSPWSPYYFSLMEFELKVDSRIYVYRWSTDLVIVCFSHLFYLGLLMEILWSHL